MRIQLLAIAILVLPALALVPLERRIQAERNELKYGSAKVALTARERISQNSWIALLAGFRGIVADFCWIQGHQYWETKQWLRQYRLLDTTVLLQPQSILFWDMGAWHMAWNIGYAERVDTNNLTEAQGIKREHIWHEKAEAFLKRGIENIPNRWTLYFKLGWLYDQKFKDHCQAEEYIAKAAAFPDAPPYMARMRARAREKCGDLKGAYAYWVELWSQDHTKVNQDWHIIEREIRQIEDKLSIPNNQRVFPKPATP